MRQRSGPPRLRGFLVSRLMISPDLHGSPSLASHDRFHLRPVQVESSEISWERREYAIPCPRQCVLKPVVNTPVYPVISRRKPSTVVSQWCCTWCGHFASRRTLEPPWMSSNHSLLGDLHPATASPLFHATEFRTVMRLGLSHPTVWRTFICDLSPFSTKSPEQRRNYAIGDVAVG